MSDPVASPGDPLFYLHHAWLDKVWWEWQAMDLPARLTDMGGPNQHVIFDPNHITMPPPAPGDPPPIIFSPETFPPAAALLPAPDAPPQIPEGDPGNTTTLHHVLNMMGIIPNATVGDVMDIQGGLLCYEYV